MLFRSLYNGSKAYPVLFSASNTSGEQAYEEFFVDGETTDMARFSSLGIITNKTIPNSERIDALYTALKNEFTKNSTSRTCPKMN